MPTPDASLRGVTVGPDGDLWFTANFANKIGRMAPDGTMLGEYDIPTPGSGARCIAPMPDGRLFFTQWMPADRRSDRQVTKIIREDIVAVERFDFQAAASKRKARWSGTRRSAASARSFW